MYNWSQIDEEEMKRQDPEKYRLWRLAAIIENDCVDERLDRREVKAAWPKIKDQIDPWTRRAIEYANLSWWNKPPKTTTSPAGTT